MPSASESAARGRTRIKFCGLTRIEDVAFAGALGVDAIGLVFAERSRRRVTLDQALELRAAVPPMTSVVALFMDSAPELIDAVVSRLRPDLLQFHGAETDADCRHWHHPYLKAIAMGADDDAGAAMARYPSAAGVLFDANAPGQPGGLGHRFDWGRLPARIDRPWLLAGGLSPETVAEAVRHVRPWGVDVSSGIETAPGRKDAARMQQFVDEVTRADHARTGR